MKDIMESVTILGVGIVRQFLAQPYTFVDIVGIPRERAERLNKILSVVSNETPGER